MLVTLLKIFFLYLLFLMLKNTVKGLLTYKALKREAERYTDAHDKTKSKSGGDIIEAEYRKID
jgi:hypothetical protein